MAQKVALVRHAALPPSYSARYIGKTDVPLEAEGLQQAKRFAQRAKLKPDRCLCSPLARARQTAQILLESTGLAMNIDDNLREVDFGDWEGKTFAEAATLDQGAIARWAEFAESFAFPGGESLREFNARIQRVAECLAADPAQHILVVAHGGVIRALICHFLGLAPKNYLLFGVRCASLTTIALFEGRGVLSGLNEFSVTEAP